MYKNIKILKKLDSETRSFSHATIDEKLKATRFIPIGINEIKLFSNFAPILITSKEDGEFAIFCGVSKEKNIFTSNITKKEPIFMKTYPFLMIQAKNEKDDKISVIGFDDNVKYIGENKDFTMFEKDNTPSDEFKNIIDTIKKLQEQRNIAKYIINELNKKDLLLKQSFNVKIENKVVPILKDYYVVNKKKLNELDDKTLALWARNGFMTIIDLHLSSIQNFKIIIDII